MTALMFIPVHTLIGCLQLCSPNSTTKVNDSYKRSSYKPEEASTLDKTEELLSKDVKPSFLPIYTIPYLKSRTRNKLHYLKQDNFSRSSWVSDVDIGDEQPLWATIKALNINENHEMFLQLQDQETSSPSYSWNHHAIHLFWDVLVAH